MSEEAQKVVVIQDASRSINLSAIKWAINGLSLKPGDELTILGVLHQVNTPSMLPFLGAGKLMGYKSRVDAGSMLGANKKIIKDEIVRIKQEYQNSTEMLEINKLYETNKIAFHKSVVSASSPKVAALDAAKKFGATWVILDRQMKKDKKYFMERLSCGISRMKRNNSVELLRGPKYFRKNSENSKENKSEHVKSNEILPEEEGRPEAFVRVQETFDDEDLFSLDIFPANFKSTCSNSSSKEKGVDRRRGPPAAKSATALLSASTSYAALLSLTASSTSADTSREILSGSNYNEAESSKIQEDEHSIIQAAAAAAAEIDASVDTIIIQETEQTEQKQLKTADDFFKNRAADENLTTDFTKQHEEETIENSVCSECRNEEPKSELMKDFTYDELHAATDGFSTENFLSEGGFGSVYKGRLRDGKKIAVKQHKHASLQGEKEFRSEVDVLSKARHKNVVMLLGSCSEGTHRLLVYEYISNSSLDVHLSKKNSNVLSWKNRMNIALGVARGLNYLHQENIIHRDMRPNNILINQDYEPLVGDFGLAKTQQDESDNIRENKVVGTVGYMAPEYAKRGRVSTKTDVYSFGVVLLELLTGRTPTDKTLAENSLVGWARPLLKEKKYPELIDDRILDCHDVHELFWMVRVAEICLRKDPEKRPSMDKVEDALKCVMNGETVSGIEDFSPTRSSDSSGRGSQDSNNELEGEIQELISIEAPSTCKSQTTESTPRSLEQSSSTSLSALMHSEASKSGRGRSSRKQEKSRSPKILYNEMLD